jgi:hypothetical protein
LLAVTATRSGPLPAMSARGTYVSITLVPALPLPMPTGHDAPSTLM